MKKKEKQRKGKTKQIKQRTDVYRRCRYRNERFRNLPYFQNAKDASGSKPLPVTS